MFIAHDKRTKYQIMYVCVLLDTDFTDFTDFTDKSNDLSVYIREIREIRGQIIFNIHHFIVRAFILIYNGKPTAAAYTVKPALEAAIFSHARPYTALMLLEY